MERKTDSFAAELSRVGAVFPLDTRRNNSRSLTEPRYKQRLVIFNYTVNVPFVLVELDGSSTNTDFLSLDDARQTTKKKNCSQAIGRYNRGAKGRTRNQKLALKIETQEVGQSVASIDASPAFRNPSNPLWWTRIIHWQSSEWSNARVVPFESYSTPFNCRHAVRQFLLFRFFTFSLAKRVLFYVISSRWNGPSGEVFFCEFLVNVFYSVLND